jgi:hypothetical protein
MGESIFRVKQLEHKCLLCAPNIHIQPTYSVSLCAWLMTKPFNAVLRPSMGKGFLSR